MHVVARDGYPLGSAAFTCDTLGVNPGERWDVLINCDRPGVWAFHCHILPHAEGADGMFGMVDRARHPPARRDLTPAATRRCRAPETVKPPAVPGASWCSGGWVS